ncbi:hypothetical protein [Pseudalkalibacillus hwajinpoensis]|nr:hypothetical protein [Pseudalkalibacillus hwajinpoensis]
MNEILIIALILILGFYLTNSHLNSLYHHILLGVLLLYIYTNDEKHQSLY